MAQIKNLQGLTDNEVDMELRQGARFVVFQYCISLVVITFRRNSSIYFLRANESSSRFSIGFTLLTFFFGWWGIPWGPIYSIGTLYNNMKGGKDITVELLQSLQSRQ